MKKFRLLLLDANVVIELHRLKIWKKVVQECEIILAETILVEAQYYVDDMGDRVYLDLVDDQKNGLINVKSAALSDIVKFKDMFGPFYLERLDDGESEALTIVCASAENYLVCSADSIVFKVLGRLRREDQAVSLEYILKNLGLTHKLHRQFGEAFRQQYVSKGKQDAIQDFGLKKK